LIDGVYTVELWKKSAQDGQIQAHTGDYILEETIVPEVSGSPLEQIPFQFFGPENLQPAVQKPPLLDLIDINKSHYHNSADLENGRHFTGIPTPIFSGFNVDKMVLGSKTAVVSTDPASRAYFLEFTGAGLSSLENGMAEKENMMATMGARLLEGRRKGVEAAETARIRQAGETSLLASLTNVCSDGLTRCLKWFNAWDTNGSTEIEYMLNTDFIDDQLQSTDVVNYVSAYLQGGISFDTLYYLLQKGEASVPGVTADQEKVKITSSPPPGGFAGEMDDNMGGGGE